jgi:peptidoglycan/LPS O-acetylase OafA/YrhL
MAAWLARAFNAFDPRSSNPVASGRQDHYIGLDALRGVAALAVLWYHFSERVGLKNFFAHGYLAVDFFFVLSGFVLARAYGARLANGTLTIKRFFAVRLIRLLPLVILGTLIAAAIEWRRPEIVDQGRHLADTGLALVLGSLLIPILWRTTLEHVIFPLNGPVWSLFFEAAANAAFAPLVRARARSIVLAFVLAVSAVFILWAGARFGSIDFGATPGNFAFGFARVAWSFTAGIVLFAWRDRAPQVPFAVPLIGLVVVMLTPDLGPLNLAFDDVYVLLILPLLVFAASTARLDSFGRRLSAISGDLSYPIYAIHYPVVRALGFAGLRLHLTFIEKLTLISAGTVFIAVLAVIAYVLYDVPLRTRLSAMIAKRAFQRGTVEARAQA